MLLDMNEAKASWFETPLKIPGFEGINKMQ